MDKMKLAHDYAMLHMMNPQYKEVDDLEMVQWAFDYADAMQAEAEKRNNVERPIVLFEPKCEVDWSQAPSNAIGWMFFDGVSTWLGEDGFLIEDAPLFGFTEPHIVERPHGF